MNYATMKEMKYLGIILFVLSTAVHLYASLRQDKPLRNRSKPFILIGLLVYYCFGTDRIALTVVLALFFSWIGDLLLIPKGVKWFTAGGISFMVSHFFFILSYAEYVSFAKIPVYWIVLPTLLFFVLVARVFSRLRAYLPKALYYPMYLYLLINGAMNCFALFRLLSQMTPGSVVTVIGALLFFISDATLFFVRFKKDGRIKTHFWVMLTYSVGEFLIVLGLIMR